jgi:hypothetical protein
MCNTASYVTPAKADLNRGPASRPLEGGALTHLTALGPLSRNVYRPGR